MAETKRKKKSRSKFLKNHQILYKIEHEGKLIVYKERRLLRNFRLHHKFIFGVLVFLGLVLLLVGGFEIASEIPILKNPFVSLIAGIAILAGLGYFYENI